jgi:predicted GNAT family acetyltransferase
MSEEVRNLEVVNNREARRFEVQLNDKVAIMQYLLTNHLIVFTHTEVPPEFEGQGIAGKIAKVALDTARADGLKVQPLCPFVAAYIRRHPEYQDLVW